MGATLFVADDLDRGAVDVWERVPIVLHPFWGASLLVSRTIRVILEVVEERHAVRPCRPRAASPTRTLRDRSRGASAGRASPGLRVFPAIGGSRFIGYR